MRCQTPAQSEESCKTREETDAAESDDGGYGEKEEIILLKPVNMAGFFGDSFIK